MHNKYHSHITTSFSEDEGAWYIKIPKCLVVSRFFCTFVDERNCPHNLK